MWTLYIFTAVNKLLPKYVIVFIDDIGIRADDRFTKETGEDPNGGDYSCVSGNSMDHALSEARRLGILKRPITLSQILSLPECKVLDTGTVPNIQINLVTSDIEPEVRVFKPSKKTGGMICKKCKKHNDYAESNQDDGSFMCYSCRNGL